MPKKTSLGKGRVKVSLAWSQRPCRCEHGRELSRIMLLLDGQWRCLASVRPLPGRRARDAAEMIARMINTDAATERLLADARELIEEFLHDGLSWSTEFEAERWLETFGEQPHPAQAARAN
jgi:hypothetical protein